MSKAGGAAFILGALIMALVAATHPTGAGHGAAGNHAALVAGVVHAVALVGMVVLTFAGLALALWFGAERPLGWAGFVFILFGAFSALIAATMSGFISPVYIDLIHGAEPDKVELLKQLAQFSMRVNQAFGFQHMAAASAAILLWSIGWPSKGIGGTLVQIWGTLAGAGSLALLGWLLLSGMRLDVHAFGIYTLAHAMWFAGAGFAMISAKQE